jgi:hypothetical protein
MEIEILLHHTFEEHVQAFNRDVHKLYEDIVRDTLVINMRTYRWQYDSSKYEA